MSSILDRLRETPDTAYKSYPEGLSDEEFRDYHVKYICDNVQVAKIADFDVKGEVELLLTILEPSDIVNDLVFAIKMQLWMNSNPPPFILANPSRYSLYAHTRDVRCLGFLVALWRQVDFTGEMITE